MRLKHVVVLFILLLASLSQGQTTFSAKEDTQFETRRQNFKSGREMLLNKGVTFEPEELLREHRSRALQDALDAMPEMHQSRYQTAPLRGAYMADTLYLPEKVQLTGHTIIVANYVVFEGKNPVIRGHYDLYFLPAKPVAVLGTTLAQALHKKSTLLNVRFGGMPVLPSFSLIQDLGDRGKHSITFDTSGPEPQALRHSPRKVPPWLTGVSWHAFTDAILPLQNCDTGCDLTGTTGSTGVSGAPGSPGVNGISPANGPDGNCNSPNTGSNNGIDGANAENGGLGENGGNGQPGGVGGDAGIINAMVAEGDTNAYNFIADGGRGGLGGEGGNGGLGGNGGTGANGGNGVACGCQVGTGGDAGSGSRGGDAGAGGNGGNGGTGGSAGTITISLPSNGSLGRVSNSGGIGGMGGGGGSGNVGGNGGFAGTPGFGATACGQTALKGNFGVGPSPGRSGAPGNPGANGASGQPGPAPTITRRSDPPPPPPPPPPGGCGNTGGDGFNPVDGGAGNDGCSPVVIDTSGEGIRLTSASDGVDFDMRGDGHPLHMAWTAAGSRTAFLALPGNNGIVNNGTQLFGNFTAQPASPTPNGFAALAVYDQRDHGGNGDGIIDQNDLIFTSLRLWIDANHDGICQPEELHTLPELGVFSISLKYDALGKRDQFGNIFRFRAKVNLVLAANLM